MESIDSLILTISDFENYRENHLLEIKNAREKKEILEVFRLEEDLNEETNKFLLKIFSKTKVIQNGEENKNINN